MRIFSTLLSLTLFSATGAFAQPTVTNAEDFALGTSLTFQLCVPQNINWGTAGANQTWDYSGLQKVTDTLTEQMVVPAATAHGNEFPGATMAEKYSDGRFVYVNKTTAENYLLGFVDTVNEMTMYYTDPMLL